MESYTLVEATPQDASIIGDTYAIAWKSPFSRLLYGDLSTADLSAVLGAQASALMAMPDKKYFLIRAADGSVAAAAHWTVPVEGQEKVDETPSQKAERQKLEDAEFEKNIPPGANASLIMNEFVPGLRSLREGIIKDRPHYLLEQVATNPEHRGKGLASRLIEWAFEKARVGGEIVYLDTSKENQARKLYERLGFVEQGSKTIESLEKYGGEGSYTHVGYVWEAKKAE